MVKDYQDQIGTMKQHTDKIVNYEDEFDELFAGYDAERVKKD